MSGNYKGGALPHTGFAVLPLALLGLALTFGGWVLRKVGRNAQGTA